MSTTGGTTATSGGPPGGTGGPPGGTSGSGAPPSIPPAGGNPPNPGDPTSGGTSSGSGVAHLPADFVIPLQNIADAFWPRDLVLDRTKSNWEEWNKRLNSCAAQRHFRLYLNGTFPCPDSSKYPGASMNWLSNDYALRAFILDHVSSVDYTSADKFISAHEVYESLRINHENLGMHAQVHIIKQALDLRFPSTPPFNLSKTLDDITRLHEKYMKMGKMDDDKFKIVLIVNALNNLPLLQSTINELLQSNASITSMDVENRIIREQNFLVQRDQIDGGAPASTQTESTALAAFAGKPKLLCANCKRANHRTEYCIGQGGKMAGKTIEEARAAQRAASGKPPLAPRATPAATSTPSPTESSNGTFTFNGKAYMVVPEPNTPAPTPTSFAAVATYDNIPMEDYDQQEYYAMIATTGDAHTSVNWTQPGQSFALTADASDLPFILDTGATCHISPKASDFKNLRPIPRHPVKGVAGSAIYALGVGDIELRIAGGHTLKLIGALYIPDSTVRLVSILALNRSGNYTTHFDSQSCWVTNNSDTVLVRGSISSSKHLYVLSTKIPSLSSVDSIPQVALVARVPDVETWHRRLGHCNTRTVVEMAKNGVSEVEIVGTESSGGKQG